MALRASDVEELPPLDLTGLPRENAYGEPVSLPGQPAPQAAPMEGGDFARNRARQQAQRESVNTPGAISRAGQDAVEARKLAEMQGATPLEARRMAQEQFRQTKEMQRAGQFRGMPQAPAPTPSMQQPTETTDPALMATNPMSPGATMTDGQPMTNALPAQGGMGAGPKIVGTRNGPMMQGAGGQMMPFVEDPITGYSLPSSNGMSPQEYSRSLDEKTRANVLEVLSSGSDRVSQEFQRIDQGMQAIDADPRLSSRQREMAKTQLRQQQDQLIWSAMGDPSARMSSRARQQQQETMERERADRQSLAVQQQMERQRQQQTARVYSDAYKRAQTELQKDPFTTVPDSEIRARAQELFNQQMAASGMAQPPRTQAGGGLAPPQPPSRAPAVGGMPAPQSGAPDSTAMQDVAIEPGSPIDFQQMPNGELVGMIPNPDDPSQPVPVRAYNLNGRAVAVPSSQAELDMLPPGSLYILQGAYQRGEMREPKRKEGDVPGLTGAAAETPDAQDFAIEQDFQKRAEPRIKATAEYQEQQAEYTNLRQEAEARAAQELNIPLGAGGQYAWQSLERTGVGERSAGIDAKGQWEDAVNKQMVAVATERYGDKDKKAPAWLEKRGDEIISVGRPKTPGFPENAESLERQSAREDYFKKRGTTEFRVRNERLINEARTGYTVSLRGGRPTVRVGTREYPGVRVREGGIQAVLPIVDARGRDPVQVANDALSLLTSNKPFAIDIGGRPVPFKLDRNDPRLKAMIEEPNKRLSLTGNQIGQNPGVKAAINYVNDVFGYLPQQSRKHILDRMLTNPNLGGYTLAAD